MGDEKMELDDKVTTSSFRTGYRSNNRRNYNNGNSSSNRNNSSGRQQSVATRELTVLKVENLDYEILEKDLLDVFERVGPVSKCRIDYDKSGRSNGSAEISFQNLHDVQTAFERFNDVPLDGKEMKCSVLTKSIPLRRPNNYSNNSRGRYRRRDDSFASNHNHNRNPYYNKKKSSEELDTEMDDYFAANKN